MAGEGVGTPRRQFRLPLGDEEFLDTMGLPWETVVTDSVRRLILYGWPIPPGYDHDVVDVFLRIESGYPDSQIDMAYFSPPLQRRSGGAIGALSTEPFDGRTWQRWSRHRTDANPWRPGLDCVETHLTLVGEWLRREVAT